VRAAPAGVRFLRTDTEKCVTKELAVALLSPTTTENNFNPLPPSNAVREQKKIFRGPF